MKKYNKGTTIVEILVSILIISIVFGFLFSLLSQVRNEDANNEIVTNLLLTQSTFTKSIEEDIIKYGIQSISTCTPNEANINNYSEGYKCVRFEYNSDYTDSVYGYLVLYKVNNKISINYTKGDNKVIRNFDNDISINNQVYFKSTTAVTGVEEYASLVIPIVDSDNNHYDIVLSFKYDKTKFICSSENTVILSCGDFVNNAIDRTFTYTRRTEVYSVPVSGVYKLEVWGAQGSNAGSYVGGYGGYSTGQIQLDKDTNLYITVGGQGENCIGHDCVVTGGYNGGGNGAAYNECPESLIAGAGGGATHIASATGILSSLNSNKSAIYIVAGGGGGANFCNYWNYASGGAGGGFKGGNSIDKGAPDWATNGGTLATGGTQTSGNAFGQGTTRNYNIIGGGGGYFGGNGSGINGAGGGSGFINNASLTSKGMYCYNCEESTNLGEFTVSTTGSSSYLDKTACPLGYSSLPVSKCAKAGNGYAKITYIG